MKKILLATTLLSVAAPALAHADAETEALRKEVKMLEARLNQLEAREKAQKKLASADASADANLAPAAGKKTKTAATPASGSVSERLAIVERKQEVAEDNTKALAEKTPAIEIGNGKGLSVTSPDKQWQLRFAAYAQAESRNFFDNGTATTNNILLRSARPIIETKMTDYFNGRIMMDFSGGNARVLDAYVDTHPVPDSRLVNLRLGKFKAPIGLERWESEQELLFAERGQTTNLVPFRDHGAMLLGEIIPDQLEYQIAYTNGAADLIDNNGDTDNHRDINARVFAQPFRWIGNAWLSGIGLGMAGTYGTHNNGTVANGGLTTGYVTIGQSRYFAYNANTGTNGTTWRANPEAWYYKGPFSLLGEYVLEGQDLRNATANVNRNLKNDAWTAITTYVLTGEDANFNGVRTTKPFDPAHGHWGAVELTARIGELHVDPDAFTGAAFATAATSAKSAFEEAIGVNWYLNNAVKLNVDYAHTTFDGGAAAGGDREAENALLTEVQFRF